jgi:polyhydroxyalkanoate synthesis regulator phasin
MSVIAFDTLKLADRLQAGGFTAEQARAASDALAQALGEGVTADIRTVGSDVATLKTDMTVIKGDVAKTKGEVSTMRTDVAALKTDVTLMKWMLGILIAGVASLVARAFF